MSAVFKRGAVSLRRNLPLTLLCLLLGGCEMLQKASLPGMQIPTYAQNQPVKVLDPITLSITKCYWADEYEKKGFENVPARFREEQRHLYVSKPKARFLILEVQAANTGMQAAQWSQIQPPVFGLENTSGATYSPESDEITHGSFTSSIMMGRGIINPGMTLPGKVVFDVPPGDYNLNFALASYYQAGGFGAHRYSFKWKLSPSAAN